MAIIPSGSNSIQFYDDAPDNGNANGMFEHGNSGITQTIRVFWDQQTQAIIDILGDNYVTPAGQLQRIIPLQHSLYQSFYATKVELAGGLQATGKYVAGGGNPVTKYTYAYLRITYNPLPFSVVGGVVADEFQRYNIILPVPSVEFTQYKVNQAPYKYVSTHTPPNGSTVQFGLNKTTQKADITWRWMQVPQAWCFNSSGIPSNIANGIGCVNGATYQGYPAGTLLMLPATFEAIQTPSPTLAVANLPNKEFNVTFNVKYFNPPTAGGDTAQGHNLVPWSDGLYYLANAANGGGTVYPTYDFSLFFKKAV